VKDDVRMRGTFIPMYALNNMFGQIPLFGIFLGGSKEGLVGVTFEVVGPTSGPTLHVNPISAVAPGLLRKFFDFPNATGQISANGSAGAFPGSDSSPSVPQIYGDPVR
jgi:hypothetical protein